MQTPLFLATLIGLLIFSCTPKNSQVREVNPEEASGLLRNDLAILLDVREPETRAQGMPAGAVTEPFPGGMEKKIPKSKLLILCCSGDFGIKTLATKLSADGYTVSIMTSFSDWKKAGLPVVPTH